MAYRTPTPFSDRLIDILASSNFEEKRTQQIKTDYEAHTDCFATIPIDKVSLNGLPYKFAGFLRYSDYYVIFYW